MNNGCGLVTRTVALLVAAYWFFIAPVGGFAQDGFDLKTAVRAVVDSITKYPFVDSECPSGARVHLYNKTLEAGTVVHSFTGDAEDESIRCMGRCLLFFVDSCPSGHFAHPVAIVVWDEDQDEGGDRGTMQRIEADWWPILRIPGPVGVGEVVIPVFNTAASRAYPEERIRMDGATREDSQGTIVFDSVPRYSAFDPSRFGRFEPEVLKAPTEPPSVTEKTEEEEEEEEVSSAGVTAPSCPVWAVIVNGGTDITDTFDEDTEGMYTVLAGHRIPRSQIYFLSPHFNAPEPCQLQANGCTTPPDCTPPSASDLKQRTSYCNLKNVLEKHLPARIPADSCEELLFFNSSHGLSNGLDCVSNQNWGGRVKPADLDEWLARVPCEKVTVVIEACNSGLFKDPLKEPPPLTPPAPYPAQERKIFTSTKIGGVSHQDIDSPQDPNPGDVGSETIWGYVEAFGTGSADTSGATPGPDGRVAFAEAVAYARENDASVFDPEYLNEPQVYPDPPPQVLTHTCNTSQSMVDLAISRTGLASGTPPGSGGTVSTLDLVQSRPVDIEVTNRGPSRLDVGTVKIFFGQQMAPSWPVRDPRFMHPPASFMVAVGDELWWPAEFEQIGNTILFSALGAGESRRFSLKWANPPRVLPSGTLVFLATVDSPKDPLMTNRLPVSVLVDIDNNTTSAVVTLERH